MLILTRFIAWLEAQHLPPKRLPCRVVSYTRNEFPYLTNCYPDGRLSIDNNPAENAIRPVVLGRNHRSDPYPGRRVVTQRRGLQDC